MNLAKSYEFFDPERCKGRIHIIGCGAIGSTVAENLARFGLTKISLYDFDKVEEHNVANQIYTQEDVGKFKTDALSEYLIKINPEVKTGLKVYKNGYDGQRLSGCVFLCVDSIELRKKISVSLKQNPYIEAVFDFRMRLTDAQHYAADWGNRSMVEDFIKTMDFKDSEALAATPVSACNISLSVVPTVRTICALGVANFVEFVNHGKLKKLILVDAFNFNLDAF